MAFLIPLLRIVHIGAGVFWVGGALVMNFFIAPSLRATGDAGRQFAGHLMGRTRFSTVLTTSAVLSIIAGFLLYGIDSNWFTSAWQTSGPGIGFGAGALFAVIGFVTGIMNGNNNKAMGRLGAQIQGKPTAEQTAKLEVIQKQQAWVVPLNTYSLLLALLLMSAARYLRL
jgi:uncharacterized membrane protein